MSDSTDSEGRRRLKLTPAELGTGKTNRLLGSA